MLKIIVEKMELFDDETQRFHTLEGFELELEHSLLSLSKWESKHQKPFLSSKQLTNDELVDYVMCMIQTPGITKAQVDSASNDIFSAVNDYINSPQSATTFGEMPKPKGPGETITSELIYYWMTAFNIPWEAQTWHLNRLFSLIRIANIKNSPPKKMSRNQLAQRNLELNEKRKAELGTKG
jgi:hypothetical protein